jgi:predicted Zn finger-like uncharacterized protein
MLAARADGMLYGTLMIIACPACSTRYVVPDEAIGVDGRTVRCAKCRHSWFQDGPELELATLAPAQAAAQPMPAPPVREPEPAAAPAAPAPAEPAPVSQSPAPAWSDEPQETVADDKLAPTGHEDFDRRDPYDDEPASSAWPDDDQSSFDHSPPFRPRRNTTRLLMIAAIIFACVVLGATAWIWRYGLPGWMPVASTAFAEGQPELVLDFPPNRQDRRTLPNGAEFFGASGTVTNVGDIERSVPSILIVMRDARERIVYSWEVIPPKRRLAPGESVTVNEAVTDVPKSAVAAEIGWKPG